MQDLIDTGTTLAWIKNHLSSKDCESVKLCTLLDKKSRRTAKGLNVDYCGFDCPDEFVIGYGMDFNETYRTLPFVVRLSPLPPLSCCLLPAPCCLLLAACSVFARFCVHRRVC